MAMGLFKSLDSFGVDPRAEGSLEPTAAGGERRPSKMPGVLLSFSPRFSAQRHCPQVDHGYLSIPIQPSIFDRPVRVELARTQHGGDVRRRKRKLERPVHANSR
jgi:hypothetical protein